MPINGSGKTRFQISPLTTLRYRNPVNPQTTENMTQYVFDYKRTAKLIPDARPKSLIEATQNVGAKQRLSINRNGKSACFGSTYNVELGGAPDEPGRF